ncbi:acyltransferase domain-containing protein [Microbacterium sp. RD1]|uniref:acyltransferase domain-containing protein n=1 Tax=Microbacterium sp. RD1 TaxID=3457313 RepID=UPI003FA5F1CA
MSDPAALLGLAASPDVPDAEVVERFRAVLASTAPIPDTAFDGLSGRAVLAALVAVVPDAVARHRRDGIPGAITLASLPDVGRKHALYGAETVLPWLLGILRGDVVQVGRLQVERTAGVHGYALHIPETGALLPAAVDASLAAAVELTGAAQFCCTSWLLDPVLPSALPGSNIAAFAERFTVTGTAEPSREAAESVCKFVFRRPLAEVRDGDAVEPRSRLERLVVAQLRTGAGWREPTGILPA